MRWTIGIFLFCLAGSLSAQVVDSSIVVGREHIKNLKDGVLLVRLQDRSKGLFELRERGLEDMAAREEAKQHEENLEIVEAFRAAYDFCPVLFFFSSYSDAVVEADWNSVEFLNDSLQADPAIAAPDSLYYVGEFGRVADEDPPKKGRDELRVNENGAQRTPVYYTTKVSGFSALMVKDKQIRQLQKPFPWYIKTYDSILLRRSKKRSVQLLNEALNDYYFLR